MKKISLFILFLGAFQLYSNAQDTRTKIHEVGITFNSLNSFGIRYKTGSPNTLLRLTLLSLNGGSSKSTPDSIGIKQSSFGAGFNVGFEKRKTITEKLGLYYGLDLLASYRTSHSTNNMGYNNNSKYDTWDVSPGLGVVLGLNYTITKDFLVAAEVVPSVVYSYGKTTTTLYSINNTEEETINNSVSYGLNNLGANVTLTYRFGN